MQNSPDLEAYDRHSQTNIFVADNATVIGDVSLGEYCTIMFQAVLRGDTAPLRIGNRTNIQDLCCLHADPGFPCDIGNNVTVGHRAVVHGARIANDVLIGIGAIVLNGATVGEWSVIAAGSLIPEGKVIPPRSLVMGVPGKIIREVTEQDMAMIRHAADHYVDLGQAYRSRANTLA